GLGGRVVTRPSDFLPPKAEDFCNDGIVGDSHLLHGTAKSKFPAIDNASALSADESITLPPEIIEGVLHQGLKGVLGSASKAGKTWLVLDAAISVSAGVKFWWWSTHKGRVLFINFEIP